MDGHYRRIPAVKAAQIRLARQLLEEGAAQVVVVCDTDMAWLHSPLPYLQVNSFMLVKPLVSLQLNLLV